MTTEPVRAGSGWLALREPADAAARSAELVEILRPNLPTKGMVVHDLGCGTGSMARWLAPQLSGPQRWVLHDRDAELLERAATNPPARSADGAAVTVETRLDDITRLDPGDLAGVSLITASALLDMFTSDEVDRFVAGCVAAGCPVLVTLSVVGQVELTPAHPLRPARDGCVQRAPAAPYRRRTSPRPGRCRRGRGRLRTARAQGPHTTEPLATRSRARRSGGGVAHRLGRRRLRTGTGARRCRRTVRTAPARRGGRRIRLHHGAPHGPAGAGRMREQQSQPAMAAAVSSPQQPTASRPPARRVGTRAPVRATAG